MPDAPIVVTGASRGIGAAIAAELARRGHTVACLARTLQMPDTTGLDAAAEARLIPHSCDVTNVEEVRSVLAEVAGDAGRLGGLVNNAGIHDDGRSESLDTDVIDRVFDVNFKGPFVMAREAFPYLKENGSAVIVNIGSFFDKLGVPRNVPYCASKAAVAAMTRCLAAEWARHGIRVVNVAPGYIVTEMNRDFLTGERGRAMLEARVPLKRAGAVDEVARLVACLVTEDVPYLTGETIYLDGGHALTV